MPASQSFRLPPSPPPNCLVTSFIVPHLCQAVASHFDTLSGPDAISVLVSLPRMAVAPPNLDWVEEAVAVAQGGLDSSSALQLNALCSSLNRLGHKPDRPWRRAARDVATAKLQACTAGADVVLLLQAVARLGPVPQEFLEDVVTQVSPCVGAHCSGVSDVFAA